MVICRQSKNGDLVQSPTLFNDRPLAAIVEDQGTSCASSYKTCSTVSTRIKLLTAQRAQGVGHQGRGGGEGGTTCGRGLQELCRGDASGLEVLVNQVSKHGNHIGLTSLIPIAVHCQPVAQILCLLTCT